MRVSRSVLNHPSTKRFVLPKKLHGRTCSCSRASVMRSNRKTRAQRHYMGRGDDVLSYQCMRSYYSPLYYCSCKIMYSLRLTCIDRPLLPFPPVPTTVTPLPLDAPSAVHMPPPSEAAPFPPFVTLRSAPSKRFLPLEQSSYL